MNLVLASSKLSRLAAIACVAVIAAACANNPLQRGSATSEAPAATPSATGSGAPSSPASSTASSSSSSKARPAWLSADGEVLDSSQVQGGYGQQVKGVGGWEGEIVGKPAPGTKFTQVKIGMSRAEVQSIVGAPTDQGAYVTGKAWIPWYFGSDRYRHEFAYKGQGRLIFAGSGGFDTRAHLIWIIHNKNDSGFR
jgi:hypothetical protein